MEEKNQTVIVALLAALLVVGILGAGLLAYSVFISEEVTWEYRVEEILPDETYERSNSTEAFRITSISLEENELNDYGKEGWELVACFLETETAWPNFGNDDYVTGIRENTRPQKLVLIFKRALQEE